MQLRWRAAGLVGLGLASFPQPGQGQVAEVDLRTQIFHEPSAQSHMTYTPDATGSTYTLRVWNTGAKKHISSATAYTYDSSAGGPVGP